jgi:hypothetical protein
VFKRELNEFTLEQFTSERCHVAMGAARLDARFTKVPQIRTVS